MSLVVSVMYNSDSGDFYKCFKSSHAGSICLITSLIQSQGKLRAGNIQPRYNYQSQRGLLNFLALFRCFCSKFHLQPNFSYKTKMHYSDFPLLVSKCSHICTTTAARDLSFLGTLAPSLPTTRCCVVVAAVKKGCTCRSTVAPFLLKEGV